MVTVGMKESKEFKVNPQLGELEVVRNQLKRYYQLEEIFGKDYAFTSREYNARRNKIYNDITKECWEKEDALREEFGIDNRNKHIWDLSANEIGVYDEKRQKIRSEYLDSLEAAPLSMTTLRRAGVGPARQTIQLKDMGYQDAETNIQYYCALPLVRITKVEKTKTKKDGEKIKAKRYYYQLNPDFETEAKKYVNEYKHDERVKDNAKIHRDLIEENLNKILAEQNELEKQLNEIDEILANFEN